jgi:hypothetical protein
MHNTSLMILFIFMYLGNMFAQEGQETILAYDDGNPNLTLTFLDNGGTFYITRFTPEETPCLLTKLVFYTPDTSLGTTFFFTIYQGGYSEPGSAILSSVPLAAYTIGWNEIDISEFEIQVNRDFYYQLGYDTSSRFSIGAENRTPISNRTWDTDC